MNRLSRVLMETGANSRFLEKHGRSLYFYCPGCKTTHGVQIEKRNSRGGLWTWNQDAERPTFTPSLLVQWTREDGKPHCCHSFITDGEIKFLSDSTHELAGQTVPLPEYPETKAERE